MMILCKTIHTLLGFSNPDRYNPSHRRNIPPRESGGLRCVIEAGGSEAATSPDRGGDPGAWGLHEVAGSTCTESIGSESCDLTGVGSVDEISTVRSSPKRRRRSRRFVSASKKFPPPLRWLTESNGRRSCFMKGERKDGRFLLTEVTIERPEVMRASRQNGRLRLHLIDQKPDDDDEEEVVVVEEREEAAVVASASPRRRMMRCQEVVSDNVIMPMWWNHRFATTA